MGRNPARSSVLRPPRLEVRDLRMLAAIAAEGSLTGAGVRLHLTQPALSRHLAALERRVGQPLFLRTGPRMVPTPTGELLLRHGREVLERVDEAEAALRAADNAAPRVIRVGTQCFTGYQWLPAVSRRFAARFPGVEVEIAFEATKRPFELLRQGKVDVALLTEHRPVRGFAVSRLFTDELVAVVAPGHPWAARSFVEPEAFAEIRLLMLSSPAESTVMRSFLTPAGVQPRYLADVQLVGALAALAEAGFGVGVLPGWTIASEVRAGRLVSLRLGRRGLQRVWSAAVARERCREAWVADFVAAVVTDLAANAVRPAG